MTDIKIALGAILEGIEPIVTELGFKPVYPDNITSDEPPVTISSGRAVMDFSGENKALRIEHYDNKITLLCAENENGVSDADYGKIAHSLLDLNTADEKDFRYLANEFSELITERFGKKSAAKKKTKLPTPVSKAAAKNGDACYDSNTFANRLSVIYPELREPYKQNIEKYGQFLPEEFFKIHGAPVIISVIKENNPQKMRKLFNLLNEIYDDGTNEIQDIIVVTILGQLNNDQELLANCVDYMSVDMTSPVIQVNKYLAKSKSARMRLENPPKYKPKKKKRKSVFSTLTNQQ
ncbi:MAG: hypothetical protein IJF40_03120 [Clostridia bacterium]|nr:hypothetical protein [Clostridia bacterium]